MYYGTLFKADQMARAGILYSHVAQAASRLAAAGTNPTVDNVRAALGGTGSKSTIGPMLKQWKSEHQEAMAAAGAGLPADLLQAVGNVYDRLQDAARVQLDQVRADYQQAEKDAAQARNTLLTERNSLSEQRDALAVELANARAALVDEQAARREHAVTIAALEAEKAVQAQRLTDRAAELKGLADQLAHSRRQLDHFQDAIANQRQQEKQAYEVRIARLESETATLRGQLQEGREQLVATRSEKIRLEHVLTEQSDELKEHRRILHEQTEALASARALASVQQFEIDMYAERLDKAERENVRLTRLAESNTNGSRVRRRAGLRPPKLRGSKA